MKVINEIALSKEIRIKNNNEDWFYIDVVDLVRVWEKLYLKFKISKLPINGNLKES